MTKLGLKQVPGVTRVTIRKSKNILFVIAVTFLTITSSGDEALADLLNVVMTSLQLYEVFRVNLLNCCGKVLDASCPLNVS